MTGSSHVHIDFVRRVEAVSAQSLGLSVDVYSPDLIELVRCLKTQDLSPGYLEIFRATTSVLESIRQQLSGLVLSYHGEGLWVTQPESQDHPMFRQEVAEAVVHLNVLGSPWLNHECATKQMAGYSFGTYLPPLYTAVSADVVAENISLVQVALDNRCRRPDGSTPLFLLEMPPLTYFAAGTIPITKFFRLVTQRVSCGLVLDMGHLWTVYRYTGVWRRITLARFVQEFLDEFPMERVVQIHVAGLATHEAARTHEIGSGLDEWVDAHAAPIPPVLFTMLEQVLDHPNLTSLRGVALEVDTKPIELIVDEFGQVSRRFNPLIQEVTSRGITVTPSSEPSPSPGNRSTTTSQFDRRQLRDDYGRYAKIVSGLAAPVGDEWNDVADDHGGLERYRTSYLPHEILQWGGALTEMFPETCRGLRHGGIDLETFVAFWFRESRPITQPYDFFLLKIERFVEFVREQLPELTVCVEQEAEQLRVAYTEANEPVAPAAWRVQ